MPDRRWTLVIVPPGSQSSRILGVSARILKLVAGGAGVVLLLILLLGYSTYARSVHLARAGALQRENDRLTAELGRINTRLGRLSDTLAAISDRDTRVRQLANLEPYDPQVAQAGIGGPELGAGTPPETPTEQKAIDARSDLNALIRRANFLASSFSEAVDSLKSHDARLAAMPSIMPTRGWLSSAFSSMREHPILHVLRPHEGIDVTADMGAPIEAPAAGRVIAAGWETGYGNTLEIDHGYGIVTRYAHCSKLLVHRGDRVHRGQRIALVGNTGLATGPHLHYEVRVHGKPVDPLHYVLPDAVVD